MFKSTTISLRLILAFAVPLVLLVILGSQSYFSVRAMHQHIDTLYDDRIVPLTELKLIADAYAVNVIDAVNNANAGVFTAEQAVQELTRRYEDTFANPWVAASRGYIDDVIEPSETRPRVIAAFRMLDGKRVAHPSRKHGNIPL